MGVFYSRPDLIAARAEWRRGGKTVVFTSGCYDILHAGHVRLLENARSLGDVLILALNTDASVQQLKGPTRPLISEGERADLAAALEAVDAVTFFDEDTPRELIAAVLPDVLVNGADWSHFIAGREEVEAAGGQGLALPLETGYSTTNILDEVLARGRSGTKCHRLRAALPGAELKFGIIPSGRQKLEWKPSNQSDPPAWRYR